MVNIKTLMDLKEQVAIITGGAGHLGRVIASTLAEAGANIVIVDRDAGNIAEVCNDLEHKWQIQTLGLPVDLESKEERHRIVKKAVDIFGRLDILINNAAFVGTSNLSGWGVPFEKQKTETWQRALEVNLTAVFDLTQDAAPFLKANGNGRIINIASIYGIIGPDPRLYSDLPMFNPAAYAASKGGVVQFTKWCSTVLAPDIRVNAITPGGIFRNQDPLFLERYESRTPLKRMAREEDFIGAAIFLASDLSRYVTGQNIIVDGGFSVW